MEIAVKIAKQWLSVLELAEQLGSVTEAYQGRFEFFGFSATVGDSY